jgi:hypothetical protein
MRTSSEAGVQSEEVALDGTGVVIITDVGAEAARTTLGMRRLPMTRIQR